MRAISQGERVMTSLRPILGAAMLIAGMGITSTGAHALEPNITVADAPLNAAFYADGSCLLTVDALVQTGKTIIDANVDDAGSRMLIHCDTVEGRRLTLLARGDSLNVAQRVPLLTREEIKEGEFGMIAWLTRSGVNYADDNAPRRYVIAGNVLLRKSPPVDVTGNSFHTKRQSFARLTGLLEPIMKPDSYIRFIPTPSDSDSDDSNSSPAAKKAKKPAFRW